MAMTEKEKLDVYKDMLDQIGAGASAGGTVAQAAFTQSFCDFLVEQQYINDYSTSYFNTQWGAAYMRVDAYDYDEQTHDLTLIISDFSC